MYPCDKTGFILVSCDLTQVKLQSLASLLRRWMAGRTDERTQVTSQAELSFESSCPSWAHSKREGSPLGLVTEAAAFMNGPGVLPFKALSQALFCSGPQVRCFGTAGRLPAGSFSPITASPLLTQNIFYSTMDWVRFQ